jgi:hypothetical protein
MNLAGHKTTTNPWRWARWLLVAGIAIAAVPLLNVLPQEQKLVFVVQDGAEGPVKQLEVTWTAIDQDEPLGGVTFNFPERARRRVEHRVSLPRGEYLVAIRAWHENWATGQPELDSGASPNEPKETTHVRRVTLDGTETTIPLREGS